MSFGPSQAEVDAQKAQQNYMSQLPQYLNQGTSYINQGYAKLDGVNNQINSFLNTLGNDSNSAALRGYAMDMLAGKNGPRSVTADQVKTTAVPMQGSMFAQQYGSDLGGLALQQKSMQSVADKLASTSQNPFAVLTQGAVEDAALQNAAGTSQLRSQLASQGLDANSGTGAAALAALQFNTNKSVADAARQNAVQGAQFQQQGLGMAGGIYNQLAGLDLQRATTAAQLGLQGYAADQQNASRIDQTAFQNAQLKAQTELSNAQNQSQWQLAGLQSALGIQGNHDQAIMQAYGLLSNNANQYLNVGSNMWNSALGSQGQMVNIMNQNAMQNAQGRGNMWGGLISGGLGLLGTALGGPLGGALGGMLGNVFGGGMKQAVMPGTGAGLSGFGTKYK